MLRLVLVSPILLACTTTPGGDEPFRIDLVDRQNGRGVPLVTLQSVDGMRWVSDSAGVVAVREPGLHGEEVWFGIEGQGYEHPADGFGNRGVRLEVEPGGRATVQLDRTVIAERLYRTTGRGVFRDLKLCGGEPPFRDAALNARVTGQDSVLCVEYGDGLFWLWGDTNRPAYPLGQFWTAGARSRRPGDGGLDPDVGLELEYFVDDTGFSRGTCRLEGPGAVWLDGLCVLDAGEDERMFAHFVRVRDLGHVYEEGFVEWDPREEHFVRRYELPIGGGRHAHGHSLRVSQDDGDWLYFGNPYPTVRVRADPEAVLDPEAYEAWTGLVDGEPDRLQRDDDGVVDWRWSRRSGPQGAREMFQRHEALGLRQEDAWIQPRDVVTGRTVFLHAGSVEWNAHRDCWVMIANEQGGERSFLGDVWYAEADGPMGPWIHARRIAWHDRYSFYNPKQHRWFAKDDGRVLYFEGTYSRTFSRTERPTPLYDYNQLAYRLDTDDSRLALPRPVYELRGEDGASFLATGSRVRREGLGAGVRGVAFLLLPPDRPGPALVAVYAEGGELLGHALAAETDERYAASELAPLAELSSAGWKAEEAASSPRAWRNPFTPAVLARVLAETFSPRPR